MKLFIAILTFSIFTLNIYSQDNDHQHLKWYTFKEVSKLVKDDPRPVLVDVYTDWCGWCKKMDKNTYEHPEIVNYLNENYYSIKFNAETNDTIFFLDKKFINRRADQKRGSHDLAIAMLQGKMSYPTTVFMNSDLQLLTATPGYLNAEKMEPILHFFAKEAYKERKWEEFQAAFESNIKK